MIKKTLGLLIIGLFSIGYSVNAGYTRQLNIYGYNPYAESYDIQINRGGNPLTQSLGYTKQMFVFIQGNFTWANNGSTAPLFITWFRKNGLPYYYIYRGYYWGDDSDYFKQGNIGSYKVCDVISSIENSSMPGNCINQNVGDSTSDILGNFIDSLTSDDYYYFNYSREWWDKNRISLDFCISNSSVGNSFCFNVDGNTTLNNSIGLTGNLTFDGFDSSYLENPPGFNGGGEGGEDTEKPITTHPCMTLNELFALRPQYNTGLCYSSDKIRNGTSFETTTQQSIYELYPTYNDFRNDLNLYQNYCGNYVATQNACQNAFTGKQAEYSLISKLPNNINDKDLYNYCDLALNYDRNTSTCVINSGATTPKPGTEPTYEDIINAITNQSIQNQAPATGTVFDELCEEGDEECLQNMAVNRDILESLQNIYEKITNLFERRTGVEGIIPNYIMRLIFLTLFFTILLKK